MNNPRFWPELKKEVDAILSKHPLVREGKMFGYPAYYVNDKLALCHYGEGLAIKLPESAVSKLSLNSSVRSKPFCPMGKKMGSNWVIAFPINPGQIREIQSFLLESVEFIKGQTGNK